MIRQLLQTRVLCRKSLKINAASNRLLMSTTSANVAKEKWDLYAGILVECLPIISKELNAKEQEFQEHLWRVEFENSLKSDHELRHERDIKQAELIKKGKAEVDLDESSSKQTAQDLKDAYTEELKAFQLALRRTADDDKKNLNSTDRNLDDILYLVVEHKLGQQSHLLLPQGPRLEGETMRQTAERVLREKCGEQLQVAFSSHAPCGFYKYKYPNNMRSDCVGAKVFFYRATLQNGNVDKNITKQFEWLTTSLMDEKFTNPTYTKSVKKFLF